MAQKCTTTKILVDAADVIGNTDDDGVGLMLVVYCSWVNIIAKHSKNRTEKNRETKKSVFSSSHSITIAVKNGNEDQTKQPNILFYTTIL